MKPLPYVWPYSALFWTLFTWAFAPEFVIVGRSWRRARKPDSRDAGSGRVIMYGMWIAFPVAFYVASVRSLQFPQQTSRAMFLIGLLCLVGGSLLRRHCWRMLGTYFTGYVTARHEQPVIDRGAYAWVRHPSYTGGILMNLGVGISLGNWGSALLLGAASVAVYAYRISVEELVLLATIGEPYRRFMSTRKRLVPYVY